MSGENNKKIDEEKTYFLRISTYNGSVTVPVSLSPDNTVDEFVKKITPILYDESICYCNGCELLRYIQSHGSGLIRVGEEYTKRLGDTILWKLIQKSTKSDDAIQIDVNLLVKENEEVYDQSDPCRLYYKPDTHGSLPLYEVGSGEEAVNPNEKHNQFQETSEVVGLSLSPRLVKYKSPHMSASNPLHRFIYSNHLQRQYDEGRLANAEAIFNRKLAFSEKKNVTENGEVKTVTIEQRGWQGIDTSKYLGVNGDWAADEDARAWYRKLDDIILDKAYLSVDKNLDTLISAANHFYKNEKITFEQFTNVILMLRYAYELRKLPNDKDVDTIDSNPAPIKLSTESKSIIFNIFQEINKKLVGEFDEINELISSSDPTLEGVNNALNLPDPSDMNEINNNNNNLVSSDPTLEGVNNALNLPDPSDMNEINNNNNNLVSNDPTLGRVNGESNLLDSSAAINSNPDRENGNNTGLQSVDKQKFELVMKFVLQNKEKENKIVSKLRNAEREYIDTLIKILNSKEAKECVYDLRKEPTGYAYNKPSKFVPNSETIGKCVSKVNEIWKSVDSIGEFIKQLKDKDEGRIDYQFKLEEYSDPLFRFYIFPLLSEDEVEQLSEIKNRIDDASNKLEEYKNGPNAEAVKRCEKYVEMYGCLKHVQCPVDRELTVVQRFINLLLSLFYALSYRFYKEFEVMIDSVVDFQEAKDDVFSKFNRIDLDRYRLSAKQIQRKINDMSDDSRYYGTDRVY